jgi:hypothetical protein
MTTIDFIAFIWGVHAATKPKAVTTKIVDVIDTKVDEKYKTKLTDKELVQASRKMDKNIGDGIGLVYIIIVGLAAVIAICGILSSLRN